MKISKKSYGNLIPIEFLENNLSLWIYILVCLAPVVFFSYEKLFGEVYKLISLLCLIGLITQKKKILFNWKENKASLMIFLIYPLTIFITQLFRWAWNFHEYLDSLRFLFAIPILIYLSEKKIDFTKILEIVLPISLFLSLITTKYFFLDTQYGTNRFTDLFLHPVYYGEIIISMSLILLSTFFLSPYRYSFFSILKVIGILVGFYISIKTESRTGWINVLIIPMILLWLNRRSVKQYFFFITPVFILAIVIILFEFNHDVSSRLIELYNEIRSYPWSGGIAPETSVGLRITFYRIGWFLICHENWYGWGIKGFGHILSNPELLAFSSKYTLQYVYLTHFHNQLLTLLVWYGIFGLIIYLICFIVPLVQSLRIIEKIKHDFLIRKNATILIIFLITQIVSGFSDMVILFKYMIMFYSFMMAGLLAPLTSNNIKEQINQSTLNTKIKI